MRKHNHILIILILILVSTSAVAQELSVKAFYLAETDLTANTQGTIVLDQNGSKCALIKVETTDDGFSFDVGSLGVRETKRVGGEMWVYVPYGIRKITISNPQMGIIRDYQIPCPIESARTYILQLNAAFGNRVYDSSKKQKLIIQVSPSDAKVQLNGMAVALDKNGMCEQTVALGVYDLGLTSARYHSERRQIVVDDPTKPTIINIKMKQAFGWLRLSGTEADKVLIDGRELKFSANRDIELMSGHYRLLLEKSLHKPYERTIEIADSTVCELSPRFIPNYRELDFKVYNNAEIWIDDIKVGVGEYRGKIEYGIHSIQCKLKSHRTTELTLNVHEQTLGPIVLESPSPIYGSLIASSTPDGAEVFVDGKLMGNTPGAYRILVGKHEVSVRKTGYDTDERSIEINEEESYRLEAKLTNIIPITISVEPTSTEIFIDGQKQAKNPANVKILAGEHEITLNAIGFHPMTSKINVNEAYKSYAYKLKRRYYFDNQFLFGAEIWSGMKDMSVGGYIGGYIKNFNIEAHCLYGPLSLGSVYWNSLLTDDEPELCVYRPLIIDGKFGYGWVVGNRFRLTPQAGVEYVRAIGSWANGGDDIFCTAMSVNIDLKMNVALSPHMELALIPQYAYPFYKSDMYKSIASISPVIKSWSNSFSIKLGLGFFF